MKYDVSLWKSSYSFSPEIRTWVEVNDPVTAALSVMDRFRLRVAWMILVYEHLSAHEIAQFTDVDLDGPPAPAADCSVFYDYSL